MQYNLGRGQCKNWIVAETVFDIRHLGKCEAIFAQGNGVIGQRATLEEAYVGQTRDLFVAGTFNKFDDAEVTELPNLPDLTNLDLFIDGHPFSLCDGEVLSYRRELDLFTGEVRRHVHWVSPTGKRLRLTFRRFVSRAQLHRIGFSLSLLAEDADMDLRIVSGINGRVTNAGSQHFHEGDKRLLDQRILRMVSTTTESGVTCCLHAAHTYRIAGSPAQPAVLPIIDRRTLATAAALTLRAGQTLEVEKLCTVHTSRDRAYADDPRAQSPDGLISQLQDDGYADITDAIAQGYESLLADSAAAWKAYWDTMDIRIDGPDFDQLAVRFALYHLACMVAGGDDRIGIAAKGLTGEGYKGHSFWDTEIFILPHFTLTQPDIARTLLTYRYRGLDGARRKAKENGYRGAMYPWEAAWSSDGEVTPLWGAADVVTGLPMQILTGQLEQHISADIAFAVQQYFAATGDQDFMDRCGYEMIIDTARFWTDRAEWNAAQDRYEITDVIGPDEYKEHVNNNAYTNHMVHNNLRLAIDAIQTLTRRGGAVYERLDAQLDLAQSLKAIQAVADKLYLPGPNAEGIVPQFDRYFALEHIDLTPYKESDVVGTINNDYNIEQISGMQVAKQADTLMLIFLLEDLFPAEIKRKNYAFYEARTLHDSSLSKSTHCVLANDLGLNTMAYRFFNEACAIDLGPVMTTSDMGIHSASMGGIWQCAVYGFGGIRVVGDALRIAPRLPEAWDRLAFSVIWQGASLQVEATHRHVSVLNTSDRPVHVRLYDRDVTLMPGKATDVAIQ